MIYGATCPRIFDVSSVPILDEDVFMKTDTYLAGGPANNPL